MNNDLTADVAVIGAGTAGLTAFNEISRAGRSVLLIDRGPLGTTCARVGCMPSKAALHAGQRWAVLRELTTRQGLPGGCSADELWRHARAVRNELVQGAVRQTQSLAGERLLLGTARFTGPDLLDVDGRRVRARAFIVATGSRPVVPSAMAPLGEKLLTTDTLFELDSLPRSIGIIGLGGVGLEMGLALARLGVRVVSGDLQHTPAGITDPAVRERALQRFGSELPMWMGRPVQTQLAGEGVRMSSGENGETVDVVLAALGRRANVEDLDLARAGVVLDPKGQPEVDPRTLRAGTAPVFLAGDVQPDRPLMHEAADEGVIAARGALAMLAGEPPELPARRTPMSIIFSDPDIAAVGAAFDRLDPQEVVVGSAEGAGSGRSKILGTPENLVRLYVQRGSGVLLGAGLIASRGEHLAHLLAWAVQRGDSVGELLAMPYYHPSVEEMVQSALKDAARRLAAAP